MKKIINPYLHLQGYNCFGCAPHNPLGVHMEFYEDGDDIVSHWTPGHNHQGWLHTLHGGIQATLLDELCGWVVMRKCQTAGVTMRMTTQYKRPVSTLGGTITLRARLVQMRRNIATIAAELLDADGRLCTTSECTYFCFPPKKAQHDFHFSACHVEGEE